MSLTQTAAPDGQSATWSLNGSPVISTGPGGLQFQKNKLINGEVTRINQRAFNGTWSGKSVWETQPATIAGKEAAYGYDMWFRSNAARSDGTGANENMAQWIEAGNYRPNTVHTLSGTGVTTTQITSPASGDWKIVVAQGATNVQVEEGSVATPFELRSIRYELAECQRYYRIAPIHWNIGLSYGAGINVVIDTDLGMEMRTKPSFISTINDTEAVPVTTNTGTISGYANGTSRRSVAIVFTTPGVGPPVIQGLNGLWSAVI
jgi:hypothetical protein